VGALLGGSCLKVREERKLSANRGGLAARTLAAVAAACHPCAPSLGQDGATVGEAMAPPAETLRDARYAIVRVLGEGGQATTFEAVDKRAGRLVAIKRFRVRGAKTWKEVELAEREATVLKALDHPALPRYVEHFEEGGELFLVTEKIDGESLEAWKRERRPFDEQDVLRLLTEAAPVLDYLHRRAPPIIHRDLKPSNVIRRPDGSFAFIDFGAVRDRMKPQGGSTVVGTFGYMAPEQFQGRAMPASDVYALGATALSLLTGREPEDLPHRGLSVDVAASPRGCAFGPSSWTCWGGGWSPPRTFGSRPVVRALPGRVGPGGGGACGGTLRAPDRILRRRCPRFQR